MVSEIGSGNAAKTMASTVERLQNILQDRQDKVIADGEEKSDFGKMLADALGSVNQTIRESDALTQKALVDPDSVEVHELTIAMSKANMAVSLTKQVVDNALKAYKEIINLR